MGVAGHTIVSERFNIINEAQKLKGIFTSVVREQSANPSNEAQEVKRKDGITSFLKTGFVILMWKIKIVIKRLIGND